MNVSVPNLLKGLNEGSTVFVRNDKPIAPNSIATRHSEMLVKFMFSGICFIALGIAYGYWIVVDRFAEERWKLLLKVIAGTLLFAPSVSPIISFIPYGLTLVIGIFAGAIDESFGWAIRFWKWHSISFGVTAIVFACVLHTISKKKRETGSELN